MAYVPPETSKINTNGIKTLPEDLHLGENVTEDAVQQVFLTFLNKFLYHTLDFCFFLLPSLEYSSQAVVLKYWSHPMAHSGSFTGTVLERTTSLCSGSYWEAYWTHIPVIHALPIHSTTAEPNLSEALNLLSLKSPLNHSSPLAIWNAQITCHRVKGN